MIHQRATGEMCYLCNTVSVNKCIIIVVIITDAKIIVMLSEKLLQGHFTKKVSQIYVVKLKQLAESCTVVSKRELS